MPKLRFAPWIIDNYSTNLCQSIRYMLHIQSFVFGPVQENTYVVYDDTGEGIIVDPGCYETQEQLALTTFVSEHNIKIVRIVNTHCHFDHVLGNDFAKKTFKAPLVIPAGEKEVLAAVKVYAPSYGLNRYVEAEVDEYMDENNKLVFGNTSFDTLYVPGHSPGHLAFYDAQSKKCLGGDVLFLGSIGRTDLPGGNHETLINSIHQKMFALPDDTTVYCGHGPTTTIGQEKRTNPFCAIE